MKVLPKGYSVKVCGDVMEVSGPGCMSWHDANGPRRRLKRRLFAARVSRKIMEEFRRVSIVAKLMEE
jgi:hypothetical protein